jgi:hypothetical protein
MGSGYLACKMIRGVHGHCLINIVDMLLFLLAGRVSQQIDWVRRVHNTAVYDPAVRRIRQAGAAPKKRSHFPH